MANDLHTIDSIFKKAHDNFSEDPSPEVWHAIDNNLTNHSEPGKGFQSLLSLWPRAALVCLLFFPSLLLNKYFPTGNRISSTTYTNSTTEHAEIGTIPSGKTDARNDDDKSIANYNSVVFNKTHKVSIPANSAQLVNRDLAYEERGISDVNADDASNNMRRSITGADLLQSSLIDNSTILQHRTQLPLIKTITKNKTNNKRQWFLSAIAFSDWGGYFLDDKVLDQSGIPHEEGEEISGREHHKESFSTAIYFTKSLTRHWQVRTGIQYSRIIIGINPQFIYADALPDGTSAFKLATSSGYDYVKPSFNTSPNPGDSLYADRGKHWLESISIPLSVGYRMNYGRIGITPSMGVLMGYNTRSSLKTEVGHVQQREAVDVTWLSGTKKLYAGLQTDLNISYKINPALAVNLVPAFRANVTPVTSSYYIKTYPFSLSVGAGITVAL